MGNLGDTNNLWMRLKNSDYKILDSHSSCYKIYFPIGSISTPITSIGGTTLLTYYGVVAFISSFV